jgi:hypothetical protein
MKKEFWNVFIFICFLLILVNMILTINLIKAIKFNDLRLTRIGNSLNETRAKVNLKKVNYYELNKKIFIKE